MRRPSYRRAILLLATDNTAHGAMCKIIAELFEVQPLKVVRDVEDTMRTIDRAGSLGAVLNADPSQLVLLTQPVSLEAAERPFGFEKEPNKCPECETLYPFGAGHSCGSFDMGRCACGETQAECARCNDGGLGEGGS